MSGAIEQNKSPKDLQSKRSFGAEPQSGKVAYSIESLIDNESDNENGCGNDNGNGRE